MSTAIPHPVPVSALPSPPVPPQATPAALRTVTLCPEGTPEIGFVFKRTYVIGTDGTCRPADEQVPLEEDGAFYDPLADGVPPSLKALPEVVAYKTGTDVVVRAHARPIRPVQHAVVSVRIGDFRHEADVFGDRVTELVQGRLRFSEPMPFEAMPLRYELAYGGRDPVYEAAVMQEVVRTTDPADLRRGGPVLESMFAKNNPLMYARNRVGRGWVLECGPEVAEGRALPNIERRDDRLTPERLIVRNPLNWIHQPIPVGFDYLDPLAYPRSAMIGISQDAQRTARPPEVERGLIPADFWRGNITDGPGSKVPDRIHPDASRVASLGLRMPFLAGGSAIGLEGMDAREPRFIVWLPRERPWFEVPATLVQDGHVRADLHLVHIDVDARVLSLVWAGRARLSGLVLPGTEAQVESEVRTHISEY